MFKTVKSNSYVTSQLKKFTNFKHSNKNF